jgi:hypothetical protein
MKRRSPSGVVEPQTEAPVDGGNRFRPRLGAVMFALIRYGGIRAQSIRERVTMGIGRVRRQGKRIGRPRVEVDARPDGKRAGLGKGTAQRAAPDLAQRPTCVQPAVKTHSLDFGPF